MRKLPFASAIATTRPLLSRMDVSPLLLCPVQHSLRPDEMVAQERQAEEDQGNSGGRDEWQGKDDAGDQRQEATPDSEVPTQSRRAQIRRQELTS